MRPAPARGSIDRDRRSPRIVAAWPLAVFALPLVLFWASVDSRGAIPENSMTDSTQAPVSDPDILQGTVGSVGGARIGVRSVALGSPAFQGAPAVASATVVIARTIGGVHVETTMSLREGTSLPLADGWHRVLRVVPPGVSDNRGRVAIARDASEAGEGVASAFLAANGSLRIGGPDLDNAFDVDAIAFRPDERAPASAEVEWRPSAYSRKDTAPALIRTQSLAAGETLALPNARLRVVRIEADAPEHPARVLFEVVPAR